VDVVQVSESLHGWGRQHRRFVLQLLLVISRDLERGNGRKAEEK
jgi:hypothetical protein